MEPAAQRKDEAHHADKQGNGTARCVQQQTQIGNVRNFIGTADGRRVDHTAVKAAAI